MKDLLKQEQIAEFAYNAMQLFSEYTLNDAERWDEVTEEVRKDFQAVIEYLLQSPKCSPEEMHTMFYTLKKAKGWTYGESFSHEKKQGPDMVPYLRLSDDYRMRLKIIRALVGCFVPATRKHANA